MDFDKFKAFPLFSNLQGRLFRKLNTEKQSSGSESVSSSDLHKDLHRSIEANKLRKLNNKLVARLNNYVVQKYHYDLYQNWNKGLSLTPRERQLALDFSFKMPDSQKEFFKAKKKLLNNIRNNLFRAKISNLKVEKITDRDLLPFTRETSAIIEIKALNFAVKLTIKDNPEFPDLVPKIDMLLPDDLQNSNINFVELHLARNKVKDKHLPKLLEFRNEFYEQVG
ncbi:MAG: hypothetical protein HRT47_08265 [Candidatus Caenarcaniphilales bacterium]|nr:hypothetical protein [Candidatus Caenarcaniphilales bacterium]